MGGRHLTIEDRRELEKYYLDRISVESIAETLRVHRSTIYNELRRGDTGRVDKNGNCEYSAELAQKRICDARRSIHPAKCHDVKPAFIRFLCFFREQLNAPDLHDLMTLDHFIPAVHPFRKTHF